MKQLRPEEDLAGAAAGAAEAWAVLGENPAGGPVARLAKVVDQVGVGAVASEEVAADSAGVGAELAAGPAIAPR